MQRSDSSEYESDSDFDADSDESYEKMRDKLAPPAIPNRGYQQVSVDCCCSNDNYRPNSHGFQALSFRQFFSRIITVVAAIIVCSINIDGVVLYFTLNVSPYTSMYELYMFVISIHYITLCTNIITVL